MSALHLGTRDPDAVIALLPDDVTVFVEYDQWHEWGEKDSDSSPGVHHVIIMGQSVLESASTATLLTAYAHLVGEGAELEPMLEPAYQRGTVAVITVDTDWSEALLNITLGWRGFDDRGMSHEVEGGRA